MDEHERIEADAEAYGTAYVDAVESALGLPLSELRLFQEQPAFTEYERLFYTLQNFHDSHTLPEKPFDEHRPYIGALQFPEIYESNMVNPLDLHAQPFAPELVGDSVRLFDFIVRRSILVSHRVAFYDPVYRTSGRMLRTGGPLRLPQGYEAFLQILPPETAAAMRARNTRDANWLPHKELRASLEIVAGIASKIRGGIFLPVTMGNWPEADAAALGRLSMIQLSDHIESGYPPPQLYRCTMLLTQRRVWGEKFDLMLDSPVAFPQFKTACEYLSINFGGLKQKDLEVATWNLGTQAIEAPDLSLDDIVSLRGDVEVFDSYLRFVRMSLERFHSDPNMDPADFIRICREELDALNGELKNALSTPSLGQRVRLRATEIAMNCFGGIAAAVLQDASLLGTIAAGIIPATTGTVVAASGTGKSSSVGSSARLHVSAYTLR